MGKKAGRVTAIFISIVMVLSLVPFSAFAAEVTYQTRDVYIWYNGSLTSITTDEDGSALNYYQTDHFQIIYGNSGANSAKVDSTFLQKCATVLENCWALYIDKMGMEPTSTSVNASGDKTTQYKTNAVLMGTGVPGYSLGANDWGAYGAVDEAGYPYFMCSLSAMDLPTVVAHEYGHAVHYAQGDNAWKNDIYLGPWFEAVANWFAEQYIYEYIADTTQMSYLYLRANSLTKMNGRAYYEAWPILQYLTEDPDGTGVYGETFVQKLLSCDLSALKGTDTMFWEVLENCNGDLTTADTVGMYASHMATLDFKHKTLYNSTINSQMNNSNFFWQQRYTVPEDYGDGQYAVPIERAPEAMGYNIIPLDFTPGNVSVTLNALTDAAGAGWTARLVKESSGATSYSDLFHAGETMTISAASGDELYLTVAATPTLDSMVRHTIGGWASHSTETNMPYQNKTQYPYSVSLSGAAPMARPTPSGSFKTHSNGGGKVATTASVAASAYVGPDAIVMGSAKVTGNARIDGHAIVAGSATVSGNAYVGDWAIVSESANVSGEARVIESACVMGQYTVSGNACLKGQTLAYNNGGSASGEAITYGDFFEDEQKAISDGTYSGYHSLTYTNYGDYATLTDGVYTRDKEKNLQADYEFNSNLRDSVGYSDMYGVNSPTVGTSSVTFNGTNQYLQANASALYYDKAKIELSVKYTSGTVLDFGGVKLTEEDGKAVLYVGDKKIVSESGFTGNYDSVSLSFYGKKAWLEIGGKSVSGEFDTTLLDCVSEGDCYIGRSSTGDYFNGSIDYLKVYLCAEADVNVTYLDESGATLGTATEKADIGSEYTAGYSVNDNYIVIESDTIKSDGGYGYLARLISSDTITVSESGNAVNAVVKPIYKLKSKNLFPNGESAGSWTVGKGSDDFSVQTVSEANSKVTVTRENTHSGSEAVKTVSGWESYTANGWNGKHSIAMYADVNPSSKYYFAGAFYPGGAKGTEATIATLSESGKPKTMQGRTDGEKALANGGITSWDGTETGSGNKNGAGNGKFFADMNGKWNQLEYVLTTDASSKGFAALFYFLTDCGTSYFDDFMLYEVEPLVNEHTVTVRYQYNGTDIDAGENIVLTGLEATSVTAPAKEIVTDDAVYGFDEATFTIGAADREEILTPSTVTEIASGMLANYNFADTAKDALGSYDAEVITKTNGDLVFDKNGFVTFPGQDINNHLGSFIKLPNGLLSAMDKNYTISMWVKPEDYSESGFGTSGIRFFDLGAGKAQNSIFLLRTSGDVWHFQDRGGNDSTNTYNRTDHKTATFTPETSSVGSWTLVTVSVDTEKNTATVYFNGEAKITDTSWQTASTPANVINFSSDVSKYMPTLGAGMWALDRDRDNGSTNKSITDPEYKGGMADVRFYSRALNAAEVKLLLSAHKTVTVSYTADGAKIQDDTIVDYFLNEASFEVPVKITKDGAVYKLRGSTADDGSVTLTSSETAYSAIYDKEGETKKIAVRYIDGNGNVLQTGEAQDYIPGAAVITAEVSGNYYLKGDDGAYIVKCSRTQSYTTDDAVNGFADVTLDVVKKYAAAADGQMQIGSSNSFTETNAYNWACLSGTDYQGATTDDDGASRMEGIVSNFGSSRYNLMSFKLPTAAEISGKAVLLKVPVKYYQTNAASGSGHHEASLVAYVDEWTGSGTPTGTKTADAGSPIFMAEGNFTAENNTTKNVNGYVTFDITEAVNAAAGNVISFSIRTTNGGVMLYDSSAAGLGGEAQGMAAYLDIVDAKTVTVSGAEKITKNGTLIDSTASVIVPEGSYICITPDSTAQDNIVAFADENGNVYNAQEGAVKVTDFTNVTAVTGQSVGISVVPGAQVRVGQGVTTEGKIAGSKEGELTGATASSGLRFIGLVNNSGLASMRDTLKSTEKVELGIEITAEGGGTVQVPADKFQDGDIASVFSAALVNLAVSNYNRVFTATPYIKVNGVTYKDETKSVSRSIYEVAAGILVEGAAAVEGETKPDGSSTGVEFDETSALVQRVLNAYVNQVGIRLKLATDGTITAPTAGDGTYKGGKDSGAKIFFKVQSDKDADGIYTVTITPQGSAEIFGYWDEYIRLNNQSLSAYITESVFNEDGSLTLTVDPKKGSTAGEG